MFTIDTERTGRGLRVVRGTQGIVWDMSVLTVAVALPCLLLYIGGVA